ncbi:ComEA family DNA-binding protein [Micromonospora sp. HNM0581]|uniref:ComEA family DNA-binding protein n=2 Tax=Bacteria TaxID=2 RepID=UPI0032163A24
MSRDEDEEMAVRRRLWHLMPDAADTPVGAALPPEPGDDPTSSFVARLPFVDRAPSAGLPSTGDPPPSAGGPGTAPPVSDWPTMLLPRQAIERVGDTGPVRDGRPTWAGEPVRARDEEPDDDRRERAVDQSSPTLLLPGPGAFDPGRRGVRALAAVAVLVVLVAGIWAWRSRPEVEPVVAETATAVTPDPSVEGGDQPGRPESEPTGELVVAVAGKVRRPGLVRLAAGARVADALDAAGGALPGVDVAMLNPARRISDGELILVGVPAPPGVATGPGVGAEPGSGGRVNLNTATATQLETLPGVGPVLAQRIVDYRDEHGGFRSVGDLRQVTGIGDIRYEQLKDLVTV